MAINIVSTTGEEEPTTCIMSIITFTKRLKKKHHHHGSRRSLHILEGLIFRRNSRYKILFFPLVSALSASLLIFFAFISFLSPSLLSHLSNFRIITKTTTTSNFQMMSRGNQYLWNHQNQSNIFYGCSNATPNFLTADINTRPNRYLLIATSGGLNQQRTGIIDAVVAAYILNATLVVPMLDENSFWKDTSNFSEIFDVEWFMTYLTKDVKIIKQLPQEAGKVVTTRVPRKCNQQCYNTLISPFFTRKHLQAVQLTKFDYRLSNQLDIDLQKLRCRVNYHALRFTDPIRQMGLKLVERMRMKSNHFVALHLRFEPDMLAFSGCYYGGGRKEIQELGAIRKRWKTLHTKGPEQERRNGKCPLSPEEAGLMLRALGFGNDVHIYVASGEIYGGEDTLAPLRALFPNIHTKESIATKEELAEFSQYSTRMAALDFTVCDESDVFVTNNNGNMAKILTGRRRYFGHKLTIRPNIKKLCRLFLERGNMTWESFESQVRKFQVGFMGEPPNELVDVPAGARGAGFHEYPLSCLCRKPPPPYEEIKAIDSAVLVQRRGAAEDEEHNYYKIDDDDDEYAVM